MEIFTSRNTLQTANVESRWRQLGRKLRIDIDFIPLHCAILEARAKFPDKAMARTVANSFSSVPLSQSFCILIARIFHDLQQQNHIKLNQSVAWICAPLANCSTKLMQIFIS